MVLDDDSPIDESDVSKIGLIVVFFDLIKS